jgi:hypothetical protein
MHARPLFLVSLNEDPLYQTLRTTGHRQTHVAFGTERILARCAKQICPLRLRKVPRQVQVNLDQRQPSTGRCYRLDAGHAVKNGSHGGCGEKPRVSNGHVVGRSLEPWIRESLAHALGFIVRMGQSSEVKPIDVSPPPQQPH